MRSAGRGAIATPVNRTDAWQPGDLSSPASHGQAVRLARYPLRLAPAPGHKLATIPPLVSPNRLGTLLDPSVAYPLGRCDAFVEAKNRRRREKKNKKEESESSGESDREWRERPRSYFYKGLKLPSGRRVDVRYRNKFIRKWAHRKVHGEPCFIGCILVLMVLLVAVLCAYVSNQGWLFGAIAMLKPKSTTWHSFGSGTNTLLYMDTTGPAAIVEASPDTPPSDELVFGNNATDIADDALLLRASVRSANMSEVTVRSRRHIRSRGDQKAQRVPPPLTSALPRNLKNSRALLTRMPASASPTRMLSDNYGMQLTFPERNLWEVLRHPKNTSTRRVAHLRSTADRHTEPNGERLTTDRGVSASLVGGGYYSLLRHTPTAVKLANGVKSATKATDRSQG
ncbi:uncharacterized protein LOC144110429 [Amblyomma americanum]